MRACKSSTQEKNGFISVLVIFTNIIHQEMEQSLYIVHVMYYFGWGQISQCTGLKYKFVALRVGSLQIVGLHSIVYWIELMQLIALGAGLLQVIVMHSVVFCNMVNHIISNFSITTWDTLGYITSVAVL